MTTLSALLSLLPNARAQVPLDISPYAGSFVPIRSMFVQNNPLVPWDGYGTGTTVALQKTIAVGGRLTVWPERRFGIEATFGYAPSGFTGLGCRVPACNEGHVVTASAKVVVPLIGVTSRRSFYLGGGVGLVDLGGRAYNGVAVTTSVAGIVGAGVELKVASGGAVRIEADDYLFRPRFRFESCDQSDGVCRVLSWKQPFQHAVILSIGWVFRGGGSRR